MRRLLIVFLACVLLAMLASTQNGSVSTVKALPDIYQGDFILNDNNVTIIEGRFDINGSIIVEENATVFLRNAVLNFTQVENFQFNMTFRNPANGNPRFLCENGTIASNGHYMDVYFEGNSSMEADNLQYPSYVYFDLWGDASAFVSNSTFGYISAYDFSILSVLNSTFDGIYDDDYTNVTISNSDFYLLEPNENSEVTVTNSTIGLLVVESISVNYSIIQHKPRFAKYWNFQQNCSVLFTLGSMAPNITLTETQVDDWGFAAYGKSNVTASDSELWGLWGRGSSSTSVCNTSISYFLVSDDSSYWHLNNTTTERLYSNENSMLWLVNSTSNQYGIEDWSQVFVSWYLDVHVVDPNGTSVAYANVTAAYPNSTVAESRLTDVNGWARLTLMEKMMNATGSYPIGDYIITATYDSDEGQQIIDMTENKQIIIPEFPSLIILPLFLIATLLAVIVYKRKHYM